MNNEPLLFIANWKENKTLDESFLWFQKFLDLFNEAPQLTAPGRAYIAVAPSFPLLSPLRQHLLLLHQRKFIKLAAQNMSHFESGPYTGEVSIAQLTGLVEYVIIGHSERRKHFHETNAEVNQKINLSFKYNLTPIVCISKIEQVKAMRIKRPASSSARVIVAYEPLFAIGSDHPDAPEHTYQVALAIEKILGQNTPILYGGSVDGNSVKRFMTTGSLRGVLVGTASLDPSDFFSIIQTCLS